MAHKFTAYNRYGNDYDGVKMYIRFKNLYKCGKLIIHKDGNNVYVLIPDRYDDEISLESYARSLCYHRFKRVKDKDKVFFIAQFPALNVHKKGPKSFNITKALLVIKEGQGGYSFLMGREAQIESTDDTTCLDNTPELGVLLDLKAAAPELISKYNASVEAYAAAAAASSTDASAAADGGASNNQNRDPNVESTARPGPKAQELFDGGPVQEFRHGQFQNLRNYSDDIFNGSRGSAAKGETREEFCDRILREIAEDKAEAEAAAAAAAASSSAAAGGAGATESRKRSIGNVSSSAAGGASAAASSLPEECDEFCTGLVVNSAFKRLRAKYSGLFGKGSGLDKFDATLAGAEALPFAAAAAAPTKGGAQHEDTQQLEAELQDAVGASDPEGFDFGELFEGFGD